MPPAAPLGRHWRSAIEPLTDIERQSGHVASRAVHVGMPSHGDAPYLAAAVESVLRQTHEAWRVRISENGPEHGGVYRAVEQYLSDPRISYTSTGAPVSPAANHNRTIADAGAPFVALLQDDDVWEPSFLEEGVRFLEQHHECSLACVRYFEIDAEGRDIVRSKGWLAPGVHAVEEVAPQLLRRNVIGAPGHAIMRGDALNAAGAHYDEAFPATFDLELWMRLVLEGNVGVIDDWLIRERAHGQRYSARLAWGEELLRLQSHFVELAQLRGVDIGLDARTVTGARSGALLSASLDALVSGSRRRPAALAREAFTTDWRRIFDRRVLGLAAGLVLGPRATRLGRRFYRSTFSGDPRARRVRGLSL